MTRVAFVFGLALLFATIARIAHAHDPFEITGVARLDPEKLAMEVTMARSTAHRLATGDRSPRATFSPEALAAYESRLRASAPSLYEVTSDGRALALEFVSAKVTDEGDVAIALASAAPPGARLAFRARHLALLGDGYTSALSVARGGAKPTAFKLLTAADPTLEHAYEPEKSNVLFDYAPILALVGVLLAGRIVERLTRFDGRPSSKLFFAPSRKRRPPNLLQRNDGLDRSPFREQDFVMSSAAVKRVIDLASELSEDERRVVVDAIAPRESVASLADEWTAEIERRANLVRGGRSQGKPADEVFDRLESKLKAR